VSKISPFSVIRTHIARGQDDITKARFLYIGILKPSSVELSVQVLELFLF
jgi:hypothetical protein